MESNVINVLKINKIALHALSQLAWDKIIGFSPEKLVGHN